ncbi:loader of DNA helicase [Aeromonas phage AS-yj]|uniref:Loader of DNA helicase n=6 Tax=Caudoviricetes TaxID=2731619 RepID=A0A291LDJ8_9CAUD|nr:loader of DNA helicase [Aeromonas phage CC2]YP_009834941.1 loader of DNA helicase [Aeromonas phage AS-sw]ATI17456.1 loader of DNA helicase [Aeromonas phage AS-szw]ATI17638.1 loader of DNA helicase [Aeromonas phage AS-yj]QAX97896.1 loader of DNA helicase [Aeromonas phage Asswx_1]QAX99053.1 loader of DNA helicase [Aeromonas phage Assk]QMV28792.1 loader of DNA helicase [Aeromonas phage AP1]UKM62524.1 putative DNA helicase loader [Aeromonas phage P19]
MIKLILPPKPMITIDGRSCYRLYRSLKTQFSNPKYQVVKGGDWKLLNTSEATYNKMARKHIYERLAKKYNLGTLCGIMITNLCSNPDMWGGEFGGEDAHDHYLKTTGKYERMSIVFKKEIQDLLRKSKSKGVSFRDMILPTDGQPWLFKYVQQDVISYETMLLLDSLFNFIDSYDKLNDHVWQNGYSSRIKAYRSLVKIDKEKVRKHFKKIIEDYKELNNI